MTITGIGSRETPANILQLMREIGAWARQNCYNVYSGHADGADWAFEIGAQEVCTAFLPWASFNSHLQSNAKKIIIEPNAELIELVYKFHPAAHKLTQGAMRLMCRNVCQILGEGLKSPTDIVICWTRDGKNSGGTGQAMRMADNYKIKIINLYHEKAVNEIKRIIA